MRASSVLRVVGRVTEGSSGPSSEASPVVARRGSPTTSTCSARTKAGRACGTGMWALASSTARSMTASGVRTCGTRVGGTIHTGRAMKATGWAATISRRGTPSSRDRATYRARAEALSASTAARTRRA